MQQVWFIWTVRAETVAQSIYCVPCFQTGDADVNVAHNPAIHRQQRDANTAINCDTVQKDEHRTIYKPEREITARGTGTHIL